MATIKIKQTKSRIGAPVDQRKTLDALGLRKLNKTVEVEDNASIRGMINKVHHLVTVIDLPVVARVPSHVPVMLEKLVLKVVRCLFSVLFLSLDSRTSTT